MIEFLQEYGAQILVAFAGGMTLTVANRARKFLKQLTVERIVEYTERLIDNYTKDEESREKLNTILEVVSGLPFVRKMFNNAQEKGLDILQSQIDQIENRIIDYELKLDNDVVSKELRAKVMENLNKLKEDKAKLVALYESQQDS